MAYISRGRALAGSARNPPTSAKSKQVDPLTTRHPRSAMTEVFARARERAFAEEHVRARAELSAQFEAVSGGPRVEEEHAVDRMMEIAAGLAGKLVQEALVLQPTLILRVARDALTEVRGARRATIAACPDDVPALREHLASLQAVHALCTVDVRANKSLSRGSLVLETDIGSVEVILSDRLKRGVDAIRELGTEQLSPNTLRKLRPT